MPTTLPIAVAAVVVLTACSRTTADLQGIWEGESHGTTIGLDIGRDGSATMKIKQHEHVVDYTCTWTLQGDSLSLANESGQTAVFHVESVSDDELVIQAGSGSESECHLHRTASL